MENRLTGVKTNALKTVSVLYISRLITMCFSILIIDFVCIEDVQMEKSDLNRSRHKPFSKFFNELRILISRTLIISSRDSVCILQL